MNKQELVNKLHEVTGFSKKDSETFLTAFTNTVIETVASGDKLQMIGFGNFEKKPVKGTSGKIQFGDRKGETWTTENSYRVSFKAGKAFSDAVKS